MISLFKKNIPGYGFDAFGYPQKFRSAREAGCVRALMPTDGLVFYAPLTSTTGFNVTGNPQVTRIGNIPCMYFDGSTYLETTASGLPQGSEGRTASFWFRNTPDGWDKGMVGYGTYSSNKMFSLGVETNKGFCVWGYSSDVRSYYEPEDNTFYHVAVTYDDADGETKFYFNGEYWEEGTSNNWLNTTGTSICIGSEAGGHNGFVGHLAAVRVYDRILTEEEIKTLSGEFAL